MAYGLIKHTPKFSNPWHRMIWILHFTSHFNYNYNSPLLYVWWWSSKLSYRTYIGSSVYFMYHTFPLWRICLLPLNMGLKENIILCANALSNSFIPTKDWRINSGGSKVLAETKCRIFSHSLVDFNCHLTLIRLLIHQSRSPTVTRGDWLKLRTNKLSPSSSSLYLSRD